MKREKNCQNCGTEENTKLRIIHGEMRYYCNKCWEHIFKKLRQEQKIND